ncbi:hypothetical protein V8C40DRAFT_231515 [Trichoderma camerunense]
MALSSFERKIRDLAGSLREDQVQRLTKLQDNWQLERFLNAVENCPEILDSVPTRPAPKEPASPYISERGIRQQLLEKITQIAHEVDPSYDIHMALFAVLMVAPVDNLQSKVEMLEMSHRDNNQTAVKTMLTQWREISLAGIQAFANKEVRRSGNAGTGYHYQASPVQEVPTKTRRLSQESLSSSPRGAPVSSLTSKPLDLPSPNPQAQGLADERAAWAARLCRYRDGEVCCLSVQPNPVMAHIFPLVGSTLSSITAMVDIFWGTDSAARLSALMAGDQNISESPQNLLSLNRQLHWWFNNGRMALRPSWAAEGGPFRMQLHWIEPGRSTPDTSIRGASFDDLLRRVGSFPSWLTNVYRSSGVPLKTGHTFVFWDWIEENYLPNFDLLQLSWDLRRVAAICGAYREPEDELYDDEEEYSGDDEGHDDNEDCDDNDGVDGDTHLDNWQENQNAIIHQWMGEVEVENGSQGEEKASNDTQSNL